MFCPQCGQQQVSEETRFCSRCGFSLVAIADIVSSGGVIPGHLLTAPKKGVSPRKHGLKQGFFIFLLVFLLAPIVGLFSMLIGIRPWGVGIAVALCVVGGLLRMVYALMFEDADLGENTVEQNFLAAAQNTIRRNADAKALPSQRSIPASDYMSPATGNWRDTNDLATPGSVTDSTTKLLEKDQ